MGAPSLFLLAIMGGAAASHPNTIRRERHPDHMAVIGPSSEISVFSARGMEVGQAASPNASVKDFEVDALFTARIHAPSQLELMEIKQTCGMVHGGNVVGTQRYRTLGTLRYSMYSVLMYLPWVRKIFVVTDHGNLPDWVEQLNDATKSKFVAVSHTDIWPEDKPATELPTHNSYAIETHVHRISDLSEHFLYFNDDFFVGKPLPRSQFFNDKGSVVYWDANSIDVDGLDLNEMMGSQGSYIEGDWCSLNQVQPYKKSAMLELQKTYSKEFARVSSERCRPERDPSRFMPYRFLTFFQLKRGLAEVKHVAGNVEAQAAWLRGGVEHSGMTHQSHWYRHMLKLRPNIFSIQDDFSDDMNEFVSRVAGLHAFFAKYFGPDIAHAGLPVDE